MKENETLEKIEHFAKRKWEDFCGWFTEKEHPNSKLNKNVFFHDLLKLVGLILVFLIVYSNVNKLNQIVLIFIKIGSLLQLVLIFFILQKTWHLIKNLKYFYRGLNHGIKAIIAIAIVLLLFVAFLNQDKVVNSITQTYEEANFSKLSPVKISSNFSLFNSNKNESSSSILNKINTPPTNRIRLVPSEMEEYGFWKVLYESCASLESGGESQGISDIKSKVCREACGKRNMEYSSKECEKDKLICYCSE